MGEKERNLPLPEAAILDWQKNKSYPDGLDITKLHFAIEKGLSTKKMDDKKYLINEMNKGDLQLTKMLEKGSMILYGNNDAIKNMKDMNILTSLSDKRLPQIFEDQLKKRDEQNAAQLEEEKKVTNETQAAGDGEVTESKIEAEEMLKNLPTEL